MISMTMIQSIMQRNQKMTETAICQTIHLAQCSSKVTSHSRKHLLLEGSALLVVFHSMASRINNLLLEVLVALEETRVALHTAWPQKEAMSLDNSNSPLLEELNSVKRQVRVYSNLAQFLSLAAWAAAFLERHLLL